MRRLAADLARGAVGGTGVVAYGWWATGLSPFSAGAATAITVAGAMAILVGDVRRRRTLLTTPVPAAMHGRGRATVALRAGAPWLVVLAVLAAWQLQAYLQHPRSAHPTLSSLANSALDSHVARTLAFTAWLAGAYHLGRRA